MVLYIVDPPIYIKTCNEKYCTFEPYQDCY